MNGFLPWFGGKHYMAKKIVPMIEAHPHTCYVEPFMGGAHVFFRRTPANVEVLNDINGELVNLFRVIKHHLDEFLHMFEWALVSREEFYRLDKLPPESLTDIQRAARFYYLQKLSFAGRNSTRTFSTRTQGPQRLKLVRMNDELRLIHQRLALVQIENITWQDCLRRYDREHTFFYLDPPYYGIEDSYGKGLFAREEFQQMAEVLTGLKGRFLLSLNDVPEVREIFKAFRIQTVQHRYNSGSKSPNNVQQVTELLILPQ